MIIGADILYNATGGTGYTDKLGVSTGIADYQSSLFNLELFPNPTTSSIQLTLPKDVKGNVEIVNMMGEKVYSRPAPLASRKVATSSKGEPTHIELDVSFFAKGIYIVRMGEQSRKLVIQ